MKRSLPILLWSSIAFGDPGPATRYLINEPASLLDLGIYRADSWMRESRLMDQEALRASDKDVIIASAESYYDFADDLIVLEYKLIYSDKPGFIAR